MDRRFNLIKSDFEKHEKQVPRFLLGYTLQLLGHTFDGHDNRWLEKQSNFPHHMDL